VNATDIVLRTVAFYNRTVSPARTNEKSCRISVQQYRKYNRK